MDGWTLWPCARFQSRRSTRLEKPIVPDIEIEWFARGDGLWRNDGLPTRGEYLVRRGTGTRLRPVSAVLQLEPPYLVELTTKPEES